MSEESKVDITTLKVGQCIDFTTNDNRSGRGLVDFVMPTGLLIIYFGGADKVRFLPSNLVDIQALQRHDCATMHLYHDGELQIEYLGKEQARREKQSDPARTREPTDVGESTEDEGRSSPSQAARPERNEPAPASEQTNVETTPVRTNENIETATQTKRSDQPAQENSNTYNAQGDSAQVAGYHLEEWDPMRHPDAAQIIARHVEESAMQRWGAYNGTNAARPDSFPEFLADELVSLKEIRLRYLAQARWGVPAVILGSSLLSVPLYVVGITNSEGLYCLDDCIDDPGPTSAIVSFHVIGAAALTAGIIALVQYRSNKQLYLTRRSHLKVTAGSLGLVIHFSNP